MQEDFARRGLPAPDETMAREHCLGKGVNAPDLATVKDFVRFHAAASRGKIVDLPTVDFINTFLEWFFAGFSRVTGTPTDKEDRSEVYNMSFINNMYGE
jgi:hypothetical protein